MKPFFNSLSKKVPLIVQSCTKGFQKYLHDNCGEKLCQINAIVSWQSNITLAHLCIHLYVWTHFIFKTFF